MRVRVCPLGTLRLESQGETAWGPDRSQEMRATLVPLLARAAPAVRPLIAARSPSRSVAMSANGKGKKGGDAKDA